MRNASQIAKGQDANGIYVIIEKEGDPHGTVLFPLSSLTFFTEDNGASFLFFKS